MYYSVKLLVREDDSNIPDPPGYSDSGSKQRSYFLCTPLNYADTDMFFASFTSSKKKVKAIDRMTEVAFSSAVDRSADAVGDYVRIQWRIPGFLRRGRGCQPLRWGNQPII